MSNPKILEQKLSAINGKDYAGYQSLLGSYDFPLFKLIIVQIPKDPYAPPHTGIYRIQVRRNDDRIINLNYKSKIQKIACADFLARGFFDASADICKGIRGTGYSGLITINRPGQTILERNSVIISDDMIEVRCFLGLPASGRLIKADLAAQMLFEELPRIVDNALLDKNTDHLIMKNHIEVTEDADYLRSQLDSLGIIAFIADGSVLPRESGTSDAPLAENKAIRFMSPKNLRREIELPNAGKICGLAIPKGITLITGGGYHGKSTLLRTLEAGIYNHIPKDGREYCVTNSQTVKIRAYDGRSVVKTDISPFISNLPFGQDTGNFSTENASGSTSQAAGIIEAIEAGARVLLMDEDTCATNFMIRDRKMQLLVAKKDEPITSFIDRVKQLYREIEISTILVLGGVGDYFDVSDQVIQMISYQPFDATVQAHKIADEYPVKRSFEAQAAPFSIHERIPVRESIVALNDHGKFAIYAKEIYRINFGRHIIDLTDVEQLTELSQTKALGYAMEYAKKYMDGSRTLREVVQQVVTDIETHGLDIISDKISGHFAWFRALELAFAINRLRGVDMIRAAD